MAIDDAIRLASVKLLPDKQKATTVGFLIRAVGWFSEKGFTCSVAELGEPVGFMKSSLAPAGKAERPWITGGYRHQPMRS